MRLDAITLTVLAAGTLVDPAMLHGGWKANVVLVPEDGAGSTGFLAVDLDDAHVEVMAVRP